MKSRLQVIVVLLFIGIAGLVFVFSNKNNKPSTELEIMEDAGNQPDYKTDVNSPVSGTVISQNSEDKSENGQDGKTGNENKPAENIKIFVHVCGAVENEGVYQVSPDARVADAIRAAGGLTKKAAGYGINQAEQLKDGMQVYVPTKKEVAKERNISAIHNTFSQDGKTESSQSGVININTATKEDLMKLNGVGEAKAALIINYRETNGGFNNITDLMKIKGIKQKFFDKIKDNICV